MRHALRGIRTAWESEQNFRLHVWSAAVLIVFMVVFDFSTLEAGLLLLVATVVLAAELFNTAIEETLDVLEPSHHPLVGKAKDIAAGAVLLTSIGAVIVGIFVFFSHFSS